MIRTYQTYIYRKSRFCDDLTVVALAPPIMLEHLSGGASMKRRREKRRGEKKGGIKKGRGNLGVRKKKMLHRESNPCRTFRVVDQNTNH